MKKQNFLLLVLFIIPAAFFTSCKKSSSTSVQCRITDIKVTGSSNYQEHLEYNSDNKISLITYSLNNEQRNYSYDGSKIFINDFDTRGTIEIDTVTLNSAGWISTVIQHHGGLIVYDTMKYGTDNELLEFGSKEIYVWENGDPIARINGSVTDSFKYDMSKKSKDGDYFSSGIFLWGAPYIESANPLIQFGQFPITYTYDAEGKIISMTLQESTGPPMVSLYSYTCK